MGGVRPQHLAQQIVGHGRRDVFGQHFLQHCQGIRLAEHQLKPIVGTVLRQHLRCVRQELSDFRRQLNVVPWGTSLHLLGKLQPLVVVQFGVLQACLQTVCQHQHAAAQHAAGLE